jgi:hypothetical protein
LTKISKNNLFLIIFLLSLWILSRPYIGIWHDSLLYAAQAFSRLHPDVFHHDIFFLFGSQDSFTIFSPAYATAIQWFGLNLANIILLILSHIAWIYSAYNLFRKFINETIGWFGIALVFTMPAMYGGHGIFSYAESFLSPRVFSEALVMIALSAVLQDRILISFGALLVATLLHPLVAIAGIFAVTFYLFLNDFRWLLLPLIGIAIIFAFSYWEVEPFIGLAQIMNGEWFEIVREANIYVFPSSWRLMDWNRFAFDAMVVAFSSIIFQNRKRFMIIAIGLTGIAGVVVSLIGADLLNNVFIIQLQTWRTAWLLHVLSHFSIAQIAGRLWSSKNRFILYSLFLSAWFAIQFNTFVSLIIGSLATVLTIMDLNGRLSKVFQPACLISIFITVLLGISFTAIPIILTFFRWQILLQPDLFRLAVELLKTPPILSVIACFMLWFFLIKNKTQITFAIGIASILLTVGTITWDRRDLWNRYIENFSGLTYPFKTSIPYNSNVYWKDDLKSSWLLLQRANYLSLGQAAGLLFSQKTAATFASRKASINSVLGPIDSMSSVIDHASFKNEQPQVTPASIFDSCFAAPDLDFLILTSGVQNLYIEKWQAPFDKQEIIFINGVYKKRVFQEYYLYDCRVIRNKIQMDQLSENG